jgi:hypothetical protein
VVELDGDCAEDFFCAPLIAVVVLFFAAVSLGAERCACFGSGRALFAAAARLRWVFAALACVFPTLARFAPATRLPFAPACTRAGRLLFASFCEALAAPLVFCWPGAVGFPRATPLPGTLTPRGAT